MTPSEIEPITFRFVAQCLKQLRQCVTPLPCSMRKIYLCENLHVTFVFFFFYTMLLQLHFCFCCSVEVY